MRRLASIKPQFKLYLLGEPRIEDGTGQTVRLRTRKELALLAYLVLEPKKAHGREHLASLLWPDSPEDIARNNLRVTLSRIGAVLRMVPSPIEATRADVRFHLATDIWVDACVFEAGLSGTATTRTSRGMAERVAEAVGLYRGDLLDGLELRDAQPFEEWLTVRRESLRRSAVAALDQTGAECESRDDFKNAARNARRHLELDPLDERAHRRLMRSLALNGDRNAALTHFEGCKVLLYNELGVDPEPDTLVLANRIREGGLTVARTSTSPRTRVLPVGTTRFVGRTKEVEYVLELFKHVHLVTLTGPGGIGKTRLALEVARSLEGLFNDGVHFVPLATVLDVATVPAAILRALDLVAGEDAMGQLQAALAGKHALLVLDNLEHLPGCASMIATLLAASPNLAALATSRERLRLAAEHVVSVDGLPYAGDDRDQPGSVIQTEAVTLFVQSAMRVNPRFVVQDEAVPHLVRICELTQGMPLALELAAGWCANLSLVEIAAELAHSAHFLVSDLPDMPERQRSLRAAFEWSWRLLNDAERAAFAKLSVFREGFTRDSARVVADVNLTMLAGLVQKSLLRLMDARGARAARYEMHGLLREFASEALAEDPSVRTYTKECHAWYYLEFLGAHEQQLTGAQMGAAMADIDTEFGNVQKAWRWCSKRDRFDLLQPALFADYQYYIASGWFEEGALAFEFSAQQLVSPGAAACTAQMLAMCAHLLATLSRFESCMACAIKAVMLGEQVNVVEAVAHGELRLGHALYLLDRSSEAQNHVSRAVSISQNMLKVKPDNATLRLVEWEGGFWLASIKAAAGYYDAARVQIEASLRNCQENGQLRGEAMCLNNLASIHLDERDYETARRYFMQTLEITRLTQNRHGDAVASLFLGEIARKQGNFDEARVLLERSQAQLNERGERYFSAYGLLFLARLANDVGDDVMAQQRVRMLRQQSHEVGLRRAEVEALFILVHIALRTGDAKLAMFHATQAVDGVGQMAEPVLQALCSLWMGRAHAASGLHDAATVGFITSRDAFIAVHHGAAALDAYAGLAELALTDGDSSSALNHIEPILKHLKTHLVHGANEPLEVLLTCVRVLRSNRDARFARLHNMAVREVERRADRISDSVVRTRFLQLQVCLAILGSQAKIFGHQARRYAKA